MKDLRVISEKDDILEFERLISKLDKNQDIELEFYKGKAIEITKVAKKIDGLLSDLNFIRKENEKYSIFYLS